MSARIGLCMIVRNESHVLGRALASVRDHVHAATILDTGSSDEEFAAMLKIVADACGEHHDHGEPVLRMPWYLQRGEWNGFGPSRTEALRLAEELHRDLDYHLILDADDVLEWPANRQPAASCSFAHAIDPLPECPDFGTVYAQEFGEKDCYTLTVHDCGVTYERIHLLRADGSWRYEGPVHEFAVREGGGETKGALSWPRYNRVGGGARSRVSLREKALRDAELLQAEIDRDPDGSSAPRWLFYLAWSLMDAGEYQRAAQMFWRRGHDERGWSEERYVSWLKRARLAPWVGHVVPQLDLREAVAINPLRAEAPLEMARILEADPRTRVDALAWAGYAASLQGPPPGALFSEPGAYREARELVERLRAC